MLKKVLIGIAVALVLFLGFVAMRSPDIAITRSAKIDTAPSVPYALVSDFSKWELWSPWEKIDPNLKRTVTGEAGKVGQKYHWIGNDEVGEGEMTITTAKPDETVAIDLHFIKPFETRNVITFQFIPKGSTTDVSWTMTGQKNFMMKAMTLFMDMDAMVGADFERGLKQLEEQSEKAPAMTATTGGGAAMTTSSGH